MARKNTKPVAKQRQHQTAEFMDSVVQMILSGKETNASAARKYNLKASTVGGWVCKYKTSMVNNPLLAHRDTLRRQTRRTGQGKYRQRVGGRSSELIAPPPPELIATLKSQPESPFFVTVRDESKSKNLQIVYRRATANGETVHKLPIFHGMLRWRNGRKHLVISANHFPKDFDDNSILEVYEHRDNSALKRAYDEQLNRSSINCSSLVDKIADRVADRIVSALGVDRLASQLEKAVTGAFAS